MVTSIAWTYPALFPKIMVLLKFCQNLTYLKPDLEQNVSDTSQALSHNIPNAWGFTITNCSKSILHSPTALWIHIIREARNSEDLLNLKNTQQKDTNSISIVITWSVIGCRFSFSATSVTCDFLRFKFHVHWSNYINIRNSSNNKPRYIIFCDFLPL